MKTLLFTLLLAASLATMAQPATTSGLSIGDKVPDLVFTDVYNHNSDMLRLSDYRGKLVILDFWNTFCLTCIQAFPKVDSLQREYGDRLQLLAVSRTGKPETDAFFKKFPRIHKPAIPFLTGDTVLAGLFPHHGDPYHVWISPEGKVLHLAGGSYLTRENLDAVLAGKPADVVSHRPYVTRLTTLLDTTYDDEIAYASYLVRQHTQKYFTIEKRRTPNEYTGSGTILMLYQYLYSLLGPVAFTPSRPGRTLIVTEQPERFERPEDLTGPAAVAWTDRHTYFYQGRIPLADSAGLFDWVRSDFDRYFGLESAVEELEVDCWQLIRTDSVDRLRTRGGEPHRGLRSANILSGELPPVRALRNQPYATFSKWMDATIERVTGQPFLDGTGYDGSIDIAFSGETADFPTVEALRRELAAYGLDLVPVSKRMEVLVLRDHHQ